MKVVTGIGPPPFQSYVSQCNIAISKLFAYNQPPLPNTDSLLKTFKVYQWYKATAEIYYLLLKSTG